MEEISENVKNNISCSTIQQKKDTIHKAENDKRSTLK